MLDASLRRVWKMGASSQGRWKQGGMGEASEVPRAPLGSGSTLRVMSP